MTEIITRSTQRLQHVSQMYSMSYKVMYMSYTSHITTTRVYIKTHKGCNMFHQFTACHIKLCTTCHIHLTQRHLEFTPRHTKFTTCQTKFAACHINLCTTYHSRFTTCHTKIKTCHTKLNFTNKRKHSSVL